KAKLKTEYDLCIGYRKASEAFPEDYLKKSAQLPKVFLYAKFEEKDADQCVFVMELLSKNLGEYSRGRPGGRLNSTEISSIGCQVVRGLRIFHALGFAPGDLKPENIMLAQGDSLEDLRL